MTTVCRRRFTLLVALGLVTWALTSVLVVTRRADLPAASHHAADATRIASLLNANSRAVLQQSEPALVSRAAAASPALAIDWPSQDAAEVQDQVRGAGGAAAADNEADDVVGGAGAADDDGWLLHDRDGRLHAAEDGLVKLLPADPGTASSSIDCIINDGEQVVPCLQKSNEVYLPFSFIKDYFEVYGELSTAKVAVHSAAAAADAAASRRQLARRQQQQHGIASAATAATFHFHHAKQEAFVPSLPYTARGSFLFFARYHVAEREKVLCISGKDGVPVSNQWDRDGYYYPIQIVQYGLSHYSQYIEDGPSSDSAIVIEAGDNGISSWVLPLHDDPAALLRIEQSDRGEHVLEFNVPSTSTSRPYLPLRQGTSVESCLSFDVKLMTSDASIAVVVAGDAAELTIEFTASEAFVTVVDTRVEYGLSRAAVGSWRRLHRDVFVDVRKALEQQGKRGRGRAAPAAFAVQFIDRIVVKGHGLLDNVTLAPTCHMGHFFDAADWIERNQDDRGGWPIPVRRSWRSLNATLAPGWYSAMAQGHALSILSRAHALTGERRYAVAARRALAIYRAASGGGQGSGVRTLFMGQHPWYEEYPTTPALFVLNGFIYSLFGLYDMKELATRLRYGAAQDADEEAELSAAAAEAGELWEAGLGSLKVMLPFYDSGTGSLYDLRHYTMGVAPNRARWDYHAVHVGQLRWLGTVDADPIFNATATRWHGYMRGHLAPHN